MLASSFTHMDRKSIFAFFILVIFLYFAGQVINMYCNRNVVFANGTITEVHRTYRKYDFRSARINYNFIADGKTFTGQDNIRFNLTGRMSRNIGIYYNKKDPVENGIRYSILEDAACMFLLLVLGFLNETIKLIKALRSKLTGAPLPDYDPVTGDEIMDQSQHMPAEIMGELCEGGSLEDDERHATYKMMLWGLGAAVLMVLPHISVLYNMNWSWARHFPFSWLGLLLSMITTFFHEIGHSIAGWFYGYVTVPSFDLTHGGGMTYQLGGQLLLINLAVYALIVYFFLQARGFKGWQIFFAGLGLFHLATAYNDAHEIVSIFAGPSAEVALGGFMLYRAWFNLAPRGATERFLNAAFGFSMPFAAIAHGWSLLHDPDVRQVYLEQKGGHAFGDFDRIADLAGVSFSSVIWFYMMLVMIAVALPFHLYRRYARSIAF